jgi:hypothetical protein
MELVRCNRERSCSSPDRNDFTNKFLTALAVLDFAAAASAQQAAPAAAPFAKPVAPAATPATPATPAAAATPAAPAAKAEMKADAKPMAAKAEEK